MSSSTRPIARRPRRPPRPSPRSWRRTASTVSWRSRAGTRSRRRGRTPTTRSPPPPSRWPPSTTRSSAARRASPPSAARNGRSGSTSPRMQRHSPSLTGWKPRDLRRRAAGSTSPSRSPPRTRRMRSPTACAASRSAPRTSSWRAPPTTRGGRPTRTRSWAASPTEPDGLGRFGARRYVGRRAEERVCAQRAIEPRPRGADRQLLLEAVEGAEAATEVVEEVHERGLTRARDDGRAVLELAVVAEDDVQQRLGQARGKAFDLLDLAPDPVVAQRDLALEAARVRQVDRGGIGRVGLELADVVQQRAGDGDVAVDPRERGADRADALGDREAVLEQPVLVGLVVVLGGRRAAVELPGGGSLAEDAVQQRPQVRLLDRGDELAQVGLHLVGGARRAVEQGARVERARLGLAQAQQVDLRAVALMDPKAAAHVDRRAGLAERARALDVVPDHRDDRAGAVGQRQAQELAAVALGARLRAADHKHLVDLRPVLKITNQHVRKRCKRRGRHSGRNHVRGVACAKMKLTWHELR